MKILVVENNPEIVSFLEQALTSWGHDVQGIENELSGLKISKDLSADVQILSCLPGDEDSRLINGKINSTVTGNDKKRFSYIIFILEKDDPEAMDRAIQSGADDCLVKPIRLTDLRMKIEVASRIINLETESANSLKEFEKNYFQTIGMFNSLIEVFDEDLGGHCRRVSKISRELAGMHPDVSEDEYQIAESAGLLHDIGMIGLPSDILSKKRTERNDEERRHYFSHPARGEIIIDEIEFLEPVGKVIRSHHEQFNGRGFPDGLKGNQIPVLAMIVSGASIYDNFLNRGHVTLEKLPDSLDQMKGNQLNPFVVDLLFEIIAERRIKEEKRDYKTLKIKDLKQGMVLARDLRMKTGALAMPEQTELSVYGIEKLKSYQKLECISNRVSVYKSTLRG